MSLTELTGVFSCGTLSLLGSLSSREASCGISSAQLYQLLTLRQTPRAGDGKERRTRQARAREMLRPPPFPRSNEHLGLSGHDVRVRKGKPLGRCETRC